MIIVAVICFLAVVCFFFVRKPRLPKDSIEYTEGRLIDNELWNFTDGENVYVWCCGAIFDNNQHNNFIRYKEYQDNCFRTSVQCFCDSLDKRIEIIT